MDEQMTSGQRGAGGTSGGVPMFLLGVAMAAAGAFFLTSRVVVHTNGWGRFWGFSGFGISLIPLLIGVGFLFYDGRSLIGKLLTFVGVVIIFAGILLNLDIYFQQTPLFATLMMLVLLAGGVGLVLRSLRPM